MKKSDCIFCKIASGEIPSTTLYEDKDFRVIFDISPASKGHVLILPKEHSDNVFDLPEETASKIYVLAKKVAAAVKEALGCDGVNILQNNGEAAGQSVFHLHMHIIPRYQGDTDTVHVGWKLGETPQVDVLEQMKKEILEKMREGEL